jgi:two-component system, cell cycle sensor histidine kinase and response regulator CckA
MILKKPFDNIEVLQLAHSLTEKWGLLQQAQTKMADMEKMVADRTLDLRAANERLQIEVVERTHAEAALQESQKMVLRQERLAAVGQLSAGVAHDFNNIMTVIHGYANLLLLNDQVPEAVHEPLKEIEKAATRAARLTQQLLAFSRKQVMQPRNLHLGEIAGHLAAMLECTIGEQISLRVICAPQIPTIHGDVTMIEQVLMNLVVNARDAMPDGGELIIGVETVELDAGHVARNEEAQAGRFVCLSVRDSGCGMDEDIVDHIFEPFFTTKDIGKGTGLGLATAYGIVKQHQGWIEVESRKGQGTLFKVFFPAAEAKVEAKVNITAPVVSQGHGETVLVVEDEPALRRLVRRIIQGYGYSVIEAKSGREALEVWGQESHRVDLLLTDLVMPEGISGKELARTLLADKPELKVIFMSGYDKEPTEETFPLIEGVNFLHKPYTPMALGQIVHRCFEESKRQALSADQAFPPAAEARDLARTA